MPTLSLTSQREAERAEVRAACATAQQRASLAYDKRLLETADANADKGWEIHHTAETMTAMLRQEWRSDKAVSANVSPVGIPTGDTSISHPGNVAILNNHNTLLACESSPD